MNTLDWKLQLTARSSIAHAGETRGTITLLRREQIRTPDGRTIHVPLISGNSWRGRLRRHAEELLRDVLHYEHELHPAAAHALRGGGALAKTGHEPLSGARLQQLRDLVPLLGVFGAAGGGTIIDGALQVGKVIPHLSETAHITGIPSTLSAFSATQLEAYARQDDAATHDFAELTPSDAQLNLDPDGLPDPISGHNRLQFHIETFPAGTTFSSWLRLRRPTPLEAAFFVDVFTDYLDHGRLGGRAGVGHGEIRATITSAPTLPADLPDWRTHCTTHRADILTALGRLA